MMACTGSQFIFNQCTLFKYFKKKEVNYPLCSGIILPVKCLHSFASIRTSYLLSIAAVLFLVTQNIVYIFYGYGQLNSTTVRFFALGMYDTSYLNIQHLGAGHYVFSFQLEFRSLQIFCKSIGSLSKRLIELR